MPDTISILIPILVFGSVAALIFLLSQYYATQAQTQRRLQAASTELRGTAPLRVMRDYIAHRFDERRFHLGADRRENLRRKLLKAGYFGIYAVNYYIFVRFVVGVFVPMAAYTISQVL